MYRASYQEMRADTAGAARAIEARALDHAISLLGQGQRAGMGSSEMTAALSFIRQLWSILIKDLGGAENDLPTALRAELISIGVWVMRESDEIRLGRSTSADPLIDVLTSLRDGVS